MTERKERKEQMIQMRLEGKSLKEIGDAFGITKQRVFAILKDTPVEQRFVEVKTGG